MPLALEPNKRLPYILDSDMDLPVDERPTFYFRSLSMRDQVELSGDMDSALDYSKTVDEITTGVCELLKRYLLGWDNMGSFKFEEMDLLGLLSNREACQLLRKVQASSYVQPEEKKS